MSKENDLARIIQGKTTALYASGDEVRIRVFEASLKEKMVERGETPERIDMALAALKQIGLLLAGGSVSRGDDRNDNLSLPNNKPLVPALPDH